MPVGVNAFEFASPAPDPSRIPKEDVLGVAALILTGSYNDQEFVRVGYYQNTEYESDELRENPPSDIRFDLLTRDINTKPRVTRFQIKWYVCFRLQRSRVLITLWAQGCGSDAKLASGCRRCSISSCTVSRHVCRRQRTVDKWAGKWYSCIIVIVSLGCFYWSQWYVFCPILLTQSTYCSTRSFHSISLSYICWLMYRFPDIVITCDTRHHENKW